MKINRLINAAPLAVVSLALLLTSCTPANPAGASGVAAQPVAANQSPVFAAKVTSDLKPFIEAGQTWALQTRGETLFAGNKAVSVEGQDKSANIKVTVFNLDDGSTVGEGAVGRIAKAGEPENDYPITQGIIRHEGKDFLAVTQMGYLPSDKAPAPEDVSDAKVSFIELDNPTKVIDFEQKKTSVGFDDDDPTANRGIGQMVPLWGDTDNDGEPETYFATPAGITEAKRLPEDWIGPLNVIALSKGEPVVQGQEGIGEHELKVPGGWDVVRTIDHLEKYPLGDMEVLAVNGNYISFDYYFASLKPHHGSYLVDLETRKITQTRREDNKEEGFTIKGVRNSVDGDFLIMKDSAYNKRTGKLVDFEGSKGTERVLLGVSNQDGTRAYGTMGDDQAKVLVDLTTKRIQKVEADGEGSSELPAWITPDNTVVFNDSGILFGVRTR